MEYVNITELSQSDIRDINGGNVPTAYYMDNDTIHANGKNLKYYWGQFVGLFI